VARRAAALSELTDRKLRELDELISRVKVMKELLSAVRRCGCQTVEECAILVTEGSK
jgi:hypothetical protein